ncbi:MAG: hypothetical protein FWD25_12715 [Clostridia bacterium]|nr:hypothetical protein [Clostridia bacterium]
MKHHIKRIFAATLSVIMLASFVPAPVALASEGERTYQPVGIACPYWR